MKSWTQSQNIALDLTPCNKIATGISLNNLLSFVLHDTQVNVLLALLCTTLLCVACTSPIDGQIWNNTPVQWPAAMLSCNEYGPANNVPSGLIHFAMFAGSYVPQRLLTGCLSLTWMVSLQL